MIIETSNGTSYDTTRDLRPAERHVLQKLFLWESIAKNLQEFKQKKKEALLKGWNNSGPIEESPALRAIIRDLEKKVLHRLSNKTSNRE